MGPSDDDDDELSGEDAFDDDDEEGVAETVVTVEVTGLSIFAAVGVTEAEREVGTRVLLDIRMDVGECDATVTDMVEDTVDYGQVCQVAWLVAQERPYRTLERLCSVIADRILSDFPVEYVWVKAAKPEPPIPLPVDEVSVEVSREAAE
jgi:dihydroneopterin aldolase